MSSQRQKTQIDIEHLTNWSILSLRAIYKKKKETKIKIYRESWKFLLSQIRWPVITRWKLPKVILIRNQQTFHNFQKVAIKSCPTSITIIQEDRVALFFLLVELHLGEFRRAIPFNNVFEPVRFKDGPLFRLPARGWRSTVASVHLHDSLPGYFTPSTPPSYYCSLARDNYLTVCAPCRVSVDEERGQVID